MKSLGSTITKFIDKVLAYKAALQQSGGTMKLAVPDTPEGRTLCDKAMGILERAKDANKIEGAITAFEFFEEFATPEVIPTSFGRSNT
ncbi:hypothetical protein [Novipirellula rosea]|uniref:Uncharacterized protein n=1 Tax=Novipirellula rosea TaxID=1031540 RepID=A0ABP8NB05_9BACT